MATSNQLLNGLLLGMHLYDLTQSIGRIRSRDSNEAPRETWTRRGRSSSEENIYRRCRADLARWSRQPQSEGIEDSASKDHSIPQMPDVAQPEVMDSAFEVDVNSRRLVLEIGAPAETREAVLLAALGEENKEELAKVKQSGWTLVLVPPGQRAGHLQIRLTEFYKQFNPTSVPRAAEVATSFEGREDQLNASLRQKYQHDLTSTRTATPNITSSRAEVCRVFSQCILLASLETGEFQAVRDHNAGLQGAVVRVVDRVRAFYEVHNPEKADQAMEVARHFAGRLDALNGCLRQQYGSDLSCVSANMALRSQKAALAASR